MVPFARKAFLAPTAIKPAAIPFARLETKSLAIQLLDHLNQFPLRLPPDFIFYAFGYFFDLLYIHTSSHLQTTFRRNHLKWLDAKGGSPDSKVTFKVNLNSRKNPGAPLTLGFKVKGHLWNADNK